MIPLVETTFKNMPRSAVLDELIAAEAAKLERFYGRITRCRVLVEKPHHHQLHGIPYHVRIELDVPGNVIIVGDTPTKRASLVRGEVEHKGDELEAAHKHAALAVSDAFRLAGRRLQDYARRLDGAVKTHEAAPTGTVSVMKDDYGFLRAGDDHEVYFHRNSVLDGAFDRLEVGSTVRFAEEECEQGPQASTVTLVHHSHE
jgi:cold shock CspA family protein